MVLRYLKKEGYKKFSLSYTQAMNDRQMTNRVNCAQWLLQEYGYRVSGETDWGKVVIMDESANIPMHGKINSKLVEIFFNTLYERFCLMGIICNNSTLYRMESGPEAERKLGIYFIILKRNMKTPLWFGEVIDYLFIFHFCNKVSSYLIVFHIFP